MQFELDLFLPVWKVHFTDVEGITGAYEVEAESYNDAAYAVHLGHPVKIVRMMGYIKGGKKDKPQPPRGFTHTTSPSRA
jgi:hypothetical protein